MVTHKALLYATKKQIEEVMSLRMRRVRAERLYPMSEQFEDWDGKDATDLYGIGKYGSDSYELFIKRRFRKCRGP